MRSHRPARPPGLGDVAENMGIDGNDISRVAEGILGETFVTTRDANGNRILSGMESIRGNP